MTARATDVHKYLSGSYIGGFFRSIFVPVLAINPGKPLIQPGKDSINIGDRLSEFVLSQGGIAGLELLATPNPRGEKSAARHLFCQSHFPLPNQSVTIFGVSTKLKVNSGRTTPPGQPSPRKPLPKKRDRPPRWFPGKPCVNTAFDRKQRVLRSSLTLTEPTCKLIRIFTPGPEPLPLMCCLPS